MALNRRRFLQLAGAGAGVGVTGVGWAFHDDDLPLVQPSYGDIGGLEILGFNDMRLPGSGREPGFPGWDQTFEFRVIENRNGRIAYCGNGRRGWSVVDVSDPRNMRVIFRQPHLNPAADNSQYIDIKGDDILVVKRNRRLEIWDVDDPSAPELLSTFAPDDIHPTGAAPFHGLWIHEDHRGRFAFAACALEGFLATEEILLAVDISDPRHPVEVARWWYPGMAPGEVKTWPTTPHVPPVPGLPLPTVRCHDMTTFADRCYVAWRDKGLIILDISKITRMDIPKAQRLTRVGEVNWADGRPNFPSLPGQTHSFGIVVPKHGGRAETVVGTDELSQCPFGFVHFIDVRDESRPTEISQFRVPLNMHGNCPPDRPGRRMGVHDVDRMIRGKVVWGAWEEGGFWGVDFSDIHYPKHVAFYVPPVRSDSPAGSGHADDVIVMDNGLIFGSSSDEGAGGLWAMRHRPGFRGTVAWNADESDVVVTRDRRGPRRD